MEISDEPRTTAASVPQGARSERGARLQKGRDIFNGSRRRKACTRRRLPDDHDMKLTERLSPVRGFQSEVGEREDQEEATSMRATLLQISPCVFWVASIRTLTSLFSTVVDGNDDEHEAASLVTHSEANGCWNGSRANFG